ncbi:hypothetical protein GCM10027592_45130 [Spirosoma flavus]
MNRYVKRVLLLAAAIAIVAYTLKDVPLSLLLQKASQANPIYVVLVAIVTTLTYILRAERWRQVLKPLGYSPSLFRTTIVIQTGIIASLIIPASGELTRCLSLQKTDGVPVSQGVGSVIAERVLDLTMLVVMLILTVLVEFDRMSTFLFGGTFFQINWLTGIALVATFAGLAWLLLRLAGPYVSGKKKMPVQNPLVLRLVNIGKGLWQGFIALRHIERPIWFVLLTILNQFMACLVTYLLLQSMDMTRELPVSATLAILSVISIGGFAVPTQGGIGTYHFLVSRTLLLYGFDLKDGAIIATYLHAVQFLIGILLSGSSLLILPLLISSPIKENQETVVKE